MECSETYPSSSTRFRHTSDCAGAIGSVIVKIMMTKTLFDKVWDSHVVLNEPGCPSILYIDLHLIHEVTSPQAFQGLRDRKLRVHAPKRILATMDHSIPTKDQHLPIKDPMAAAQVRQLEANCEEFGITLYPIGNARQGIIHVIGPELGQTQPGKTIVCGDSHTSTHGAFGALAFGIGTSEVEQVLATQCLLQNRPRTFEVRIDGALGPGISAKDIILALLSRIGVDGGTGHVIEYRGSTVRALDMEERMTVCNMSIEGGARAGMMAPDDTTFQFLDGKPFSPQGVEWERAIQKWRQLHSDEGAQFDKCITLDAGSLEPMITFGTNPGMGIAVTSRIPDPDHQTDPSQKRTLAKSLAYMGLKPGAPILGQKLDVVFVGSCTNGRIADIRAAARILKGRKVHPNLKMLVVPGSHAVKSAAEQEGLHRIFLEAGAEWREPGCSMCIAMNGDELSPGQYCVSTSNRNFEGRQGKGGRTMLASPLTAAACAIQGAVADVRKFL
jgi:3-isopropylmalate/(R)-2-methylmalate dehydratase large subunit